MTPRRRLEPDELVDWLRLARSDNVGPRTFATLLERHGSAGAALEALPALARRGGSRPLAIASADAIEAERDAIARAGLDLLPSCDPDYPAPLRAIDSPPPLLLVRGRRSALAAPAVALVGSRNASAAMMTFTERLAQALGEAGYIVVSGLARGIDARAHAASLVTGTVAVLAGGHERIYPSEHEGLAARIADNGGAVISEMPVSWEPRNRDFPRRNRIVSGLSLATVVVEAAQRSGSLITARFANEQGRAVFAVPGSPMDPRAEGANALLKAGALICRGPDDLLEELEPLVARPTVFSLREPDFGPDGLYWSENLDASPESGAEPVPPLAAGTNKALILDLVGFEPVTVDDVIRASRLTAGEVRSHLFDLEAEGVLVRNGVNAVCRR